MLCNPFAKTLNFVFVCDFVTVIIRARLYSDSNRRGRHPNRIDQLTLTFVCVISVGTYIVTGTRVTQTFVEPPQCPVVRLRHDSFDFLKYTQNAMLFALVMIDGKINNCLTVQ